MMLTARAPNRLIHETSPYLLQHAHNPVDWYAWGPAALERARRENRPIFLSVGYSTCYWCHVMERQCFENEAIARLMNERFVCIKVDREERPDVDQLYMLAVQIITRQGGWPMSVFLTPDLKPFYGGTYFPPQDSHGRPGFPRVLMSVDDAFRNRPDAVNDSASEITELIARVSKPRSAQQPIEVNVAFIQELISRSTSAYDPRHGGYSSAPKFPRQTLLELLLVAIAEGFFSQSSISNPQPAVLHTLDRMMRGGIRDHLGGGFHRYSTDERWLVPHFEIMLYDNAMLAVCYARAWQLTGKPEYSQVTRDILDFVLRQMTRADGAFFTAFDAEVDAMEGAPYLWTRDQVIDVLRDAETRTWSDDQIARFCRVYGLEDGPNFADPHHGNGQPDQNVLFITDDTPSSELASVLLDAEWKSMRSALLAARMQRMQPLLDTKVLTSWNALMVRAMALAGRVLGERRYIEAAGAAAKCLLGRTPETAGPPGPHTQDSRLSSLNPEPRAPSASQSAIPHAFLDDYAFLALALLELHEATSDSSWRVEATRLIEVMKAKFLDAEGGGFFFTPVDATELPVRQKTAQDSPLPGGNAVAAMALLALGDTPEARRTIEVFAQSLDDQAEGMSSMLQAAMCYVQAHGPIRVEPATPRVENRPDSMEAVAKSAVRLAARWTSPAELLIDVEIAKPFHINAHETSAGLIPTTLTLSLPAGIAAAIEYPPGEERQFAFTDSPLRIYAGKVTLLARLSKPLEPGAALRAVVSYQPCSEDACLSPARAAVEIRA